MNTYTKRAHVQSNRSQNGNKTLRRGASNMRKGDKIHVLEARVNGKYKEGVCSNILKPWNVSQCFLLLLLFLSSSPYPLFWSVVFRNCCHTMICCSCVCWPRSHRSHSQSSTTSVHRNGDPSFQVLLCRFQQDRQPASRHPSFLNSTHQLQKFIEFNLSVFVQIYFIQDFM